MNDLTVKEICERFNEAGFNVPEKRYRHWEEEGEPLQKYTGKPATIEELRYFTYICGASAAYLLQGLEPPLLRSIGGTSQEDIRRFLYNEFTVNIINDLGKMTSDQQLAFNVFWSAFIKPMVADPDRRQESFESYKTHISELYSSVSQLVLAADPRLNTRTSNNTRRQTTDDRRQTTDDRRQTTDDRRA